jgi:hypothetical protein
MIVAVRRRWWLPGVLAIVLALLLATDARAWLQAPARTLAAIDCNCRPTKARIARYRAVLDRLATRCQESPSRLGYVSKTATEVLRQSGRRRTNLWLLTELDRRVPKQVARQQPCRYVVALFLPVP